MCFKKTSETLWLDRLLKEYKKYQVGGCHITGKTPVVRNESDYRFYETDYWLA